MERSLFAQRLKEAREERGYSQAVLGDMVGLSKAAVCQYENGKHMPSIEHSRRLAHALGVSYNWLIGFSEYRYKIETQHLSEVYIELSDERKKELYNFAQYLQRKDIEDNEGFGEV